MDWFGLPGELIADSLAGPLASPSFWSGELVPASTTNLGLTASLVPQISSSSLNSGKPLMSSLPSPVLRLSSFPFLYFLFRLFIVSRQCFGLFSPRNELISYLSRFSCSAIFPHIASRLFPFFLLLYSWRYTFMRIVNSPSLQRTRSVSFVCRPCAWLVWPDVEAWLTSWEGRWISGWSLWLAWGLSGGK